MAQAADGAMIPLNKEQFDSFLKHGSTNVATVGDVFMVRGCHFEVETISEYGISAKGISKKEYENKTVRVEAKLDTSSPNTPAALKLQDGHMI